MRPGINMKSTDGTPAKLLPTDTGRTYAAIVATRGPNSPYDVISWEDFQRTYGDRTPQTARYWDAVESFYKYGGGPLQIIRAIANGVLASVDLPDADAGTSLVATAVGQGTYYNGLRLAITETDGQVQLEITHVDDPSVSEESPLTDDPALLVEWAKSSRYFRLAIDAGDPLPAPTVVDAPLAFAGGTDDFAAITRVERLAALAKVVPDEGPGQYAIPGASTTEEWEGILGLAESWGRDAVLDFPDTADEATLTTLANSVRLPGRNGAGFAGWLREPGPAGLPKTVAPSLAVCALIAVWDRASGGLGQNKPVAGSRRGIFSRCLGVSQDWSDPDTRTRLNAAGVNLIRDRFPGVMVYGWRSLADPSSESGWVNFGHRRLETALEAKINAALDSYTFEEIDGEGNLLKEAQAVVETQVLHPYWEEGSLYGPTFNDAAKVDITTVNDAATAQDRQLNINVTVVESEFAEEINVNIIKNLITEGVNA